MPWRRRTLAGVLLALLASPNVDARTWYVEPDGSGDAPTIQAAIDSAQAGDEVLLARGIYTRSRQGDDGEDINASMIVMKADVSLRGEAGPEGTTLWGEDAVRLIRCRNTGVVRIEGLTLSGGRSPGGAGIQADATSHPLVSNCTIQNNRTITKSPGAGIFCVSATITNCKILFNTADGHGGGIASGSAVISHSTIRGNRSLGSLEFDAGGGGISSGHATITDCRIEDNQAIAATSARGGGVHVGGGTIARCTLVANTVEGATRASDGAGIYASGALAVSDCIFVRNQALRGGPAASGGAAIEGGPATLTRCTIVGNAGRSAVSLGSGASVVSSIIAFNEGSSSNGEAIFSCTDVFGNTFGDGISGSDGGGNFRADPQFCAVDPVTTLNVTLQIDSPCAPGNHPNGTTCDLIGSGPVACSAVAVERESWSNVKARYR